MAGITQTIPNFVGGISEQPDNLKFPGQLKNITNAIPDITNGLFKRPGAKRVGTSPLSQVQSSGSWFHYFRDETEGSYIGQIAADGQVKVWSCNNGQLMTTSYTVDGTDHQTAIQNYLATASPENIQTLTINDTTFVNNRDTTNANTLVGTTGSTDSTPDAYYAFVELLRTENGRQYGLNVFSTADVTTVNRATRLKIQSDTLDESDGTGHCPGIGTQVFSIDSGSKTNLIFRINTLGQQGVSPNYSASQNGPGGNNYRCSYNREVVLLHGGEGWTTGDTTTVTMEGFNYTIRVEDHESTQVNATLGSAVGDGLVRPEPTPFDADTAVTADTILGGIVAELPGGVSAKVIGTGIYIYSSNSFNVQVVEDDLMRVMQSSVNDVQNLPNQCKNGYIVKVSNALRAEEDDYYLRFDGQNNKDGSGSWSECAKPSIPKTLTNMPIVIQRTAATTFTVRPFTYQDRRVGDELTNPLPSFVGKRINKVLFFRNRLAFLSGENVITSRPGTLGTPDFFIETALTVSAADPIDISAASMFPSELFDGIETNTGLVVFSTNQQFLLASDDTVLNPDTAKLRSISTFNYNKTISPISLGTTLAYVDNSGKFSRFNEMANVRREGEPNIVEVSKVIPTLIPKDIDLLTNSRDNSLVLLGKTNSDTVIGYKYFQVAENRQQASWFQWKFNNPLLYHFIIDDQYFFLDTDYYLQKIQLVQGDTDPTVVSNDTEFLLHLDNHTTLNGGVYNNSTNVTTFSGVSWLSNITTPNYTLAVIDKEGRFALPTVSSTTLTLTGDWSNSSLPSGQGAFTIGYIYDYEIKFPTFYPTKVENNKPTADVNSSLVLHRVKLHFGKVGSYNTTLNRVGKLSYTDQHESTIVDQTEAADVPYLAEFIKTVPVYERNTNVDITLKSTHPSPATLHAMSWEGDYSPKFYQRV
tara:strand:- start:83 stop:2857 length:2775 start_codon:yes stop_codon:yes gene_type:complete